VAQHTELRAAPGLRIRAVISFQSVKSTVFKVATICSMTARAIHIPLDREELRPVGMVVELWLSRLARCLILKAHCPLSATMLRQILGAVFSLVVEEVLVAACGPGLWPTTATAARQPLVGLGLVSALPIIQVLAAVASPADVLHSVQAAAVPAVSSLRNRTTMARWILPTILLSTSLSWARLQ